ncbi:MAG: potassium channel family protein [Gammaproteobacteria bacterium]|nr:potassium channel family protein [Gammaproteobacteria bacterium]
MLFDDVKHHNFSFLLSGLLLCILLLPLISGLDIVETALIREFALLQVLLFGVWSMIGDRKWFRIGIVLTVLTGLLTLSSAFIPGIWLSRAITLITLLFLLLSSAFCFKSVFSTGKVDINRLYGAACIYLMLAMIWALMYMLLDSFYGESLTNVNSNHSFWEYLYFSFVTLTTLGYGDIAPVTSAARVLSGFEAVVGQFYLTILVAALVGVHVSQQYSDREHQDK